MIYQGRNKYPVTEAVLHTSATPAGWTRGRKVEELRDEIDKWHKAKGWRAIGYHFVVHPNGSYAVGRPVTEIGAHVVGHNRGTIGICMIPVADHNGIKSFDNYFTAAQRATVLQLIEKLEVTKVSGHNQYANKECPGFHVVESEWLLSELSWWQKLWNWFRGWF